MPDNRHSFLEVIVGEGKYPEIRIGIKDFIFFNDP